ncbi:MAG TPA: DUF1533 domain-containing protein [Firmicutes bacterium]|nr:DUF1533 domain-containing protein [Bacillota bacterium]
MKVNERESAMRYWSYFALALLFIITIGFQMPNAVQAAGDDITISGPGLNNPGGITITQKQLQGEEPLSPELKLLYGKEYLQQYDEWYSTINSWPTKSWFRGVGVKLTELLDLAGGIKPQATRIVFTARDGFKVDFTIDELLGEPRYRFPNFMDTGLPGHFPGDSSSAVQVETIIAHKSFSTQDYAEIIKDTFFSSSDANHLLYGQRAVTQQTSPRFAKYTKSIEVLIDDPVSQWEKPTASIPPGEVPVGAKVELHAPEDDEDKVHYTLDGSDPTIHSPMYNWVAKRWWPSWGEELSEINCPIEILEDTTIRAFVTGPGRRDSEVASFAYTVPYVPVTGISIDGGDLNLYVGEIAYPKAIVQPENATEKGVIWSTDDAAIAVVSETGRISAISEGKTTITAAVVGGNFTASITVTVVATTDPPRLIADTTNNVVGHAIGIVFKDDGFWRKAITGVSIDGRPLRADEYVIHEGKIAFKAGLFTSVKNYIVIIRAAGYGDATLTQPIRGDSESGSTLKEPPGLTADSGDPREIYITYTDGAAWQAAITDVLVNGSSAAGRYRVDAGKISIEYTLFDTVGDYTVTIVASGYQNATVTLKISAFLIITGDGVANPMEYTLARLEGMPQHQEVYSVINTWPTKSWSVGKGVRLDYLLGPEQANMRSGATIVNFFARDGYKRTLTVKELFVDCRYRFPGLMEGGSGSEGHLPGSAEGAIETDTILGLQKADGTTDPSAMNIVETPMLMLGQRAVTEQTGPSHVKNVSRIEVLTGYVPQWERPTASVPPGEVPMGTQVELESTYNDDDKVHYTLDGSSPTYDSSMYNWLAKRWWAQRGDEIVREINHPIEINKDTTIKAITIGPGRADSEIAVFDYTVIRAAAGRVLPDKDNVIKFGDKVLLEIPAGALPGGRSVEVKIESIEKPPPLPPDLRLLGNVFEFSVDGRKTFTFNKKVMLRFTIDAESVGKDGELAVYYYDEEECRWVKIGGTVKDSTISVEVDHFTKFAVMVAGGPVSSKMIAPDKGGTVGFGKEVLLEIPAGALTGNKAAEVKITLVETPPAIPVGYKLLSAVYGLSIDGKISYNFAKKVQVTLCFDPETLGENEVPTIHYYDERQGGWVDGGGTTKGNVISAGLDHPAMFAVLATVVKKEPQLTDIAGHWAFHGIQKLAALGVVSGYPDGSFRPDNDITRAEFVTLLTGIFQLESKPGGIFADTELHWARDSIASAVSRGIASGYGADIFGPDDPLTREQMAVMIVRAAKLLSSGGDPQFADSGSVSSWAVNALFTAAKNGIISGYPDNTFRPQGPSTRAEAVTVIARALQKM